MIAKGHSLIGPTITASAPLAPRTLMPYDKANSAILSPEGNLSTGDFDGLSGFIPTILFAPTNEKLTPTIFLIEPGRLTSERLLKSNRRVDNGARSTIP